MSSSNISGNIPNAGSEASSSARKLTSLEKFESSLNQKIRSIERLATENLNEAWERAGHLFADGEYDVAEKVGGEEASRALEILGVSLKTVSERLIPKEVREIGISEEDCAYFIKAAIQHPLLIGNIFNAIKSFSRDAILNCLDNLKVILEKNKTFYKLPDHESIIGLAFSWLNPKSEYFPQQLANCAVLYSYADSTQHPYLFDSYPEMEKTLLECFTGETKLDRSDVEVLCKNEQAKQDAITQLCKKLDPSAYQLLKTLLASSSFFPLSNEARILLETDYAAFKEVSSARYKSFILLHDVEHVFREQRGFQDFLSSGSLESYGLIDYFKSGSFRPTTYNNLKSSLMALYTSSKFCNLDLDTVHRIEPFIKSRIDRDAELLILLDNDDLFKPVMPAIHECFESLGQEYSTVDVNAISQLNEIRKNHDIISAKLKQLEALINCFNEAPVMREVPFLVSAAQSLMQQIVTPSPDIPMNYVQQQIAKFLTLKPFVTSPSISKFPQILEASESLKDYIDHASGNSSLPANLRETFSRIVDKAQQAKAQFSSLLGIPELSLNETESFLLKIPESSLNKTESEVDFQLLLDSETINYLGRYQYSSLIISEAVRQFRGIFQKFLMQKPEKRKQTSELIKQEVERFSKYLTSLVYLFKNANLHFHLSNKKYSEEIKKSLENLKNASQSESEHLSKRIERQCDFLAVLSKTADLNPLILDKIIPVVNAYILSGVSVNEEEIRKIYALYERFPDFPSASFFYLKDPSIIEQLEHLPELLNQPFENLQTLFQNLHKHKDIPLVRDMIEELQENLKQLREGKEVPQIQMQVNNLIVFFELLEEIRVEKEEYLQGIELNPTLMPFFEGEALIDANEKETVIKNLLEQIDVYVTEMEKRRMESQAIRANPLRNISREAIKHQAAAFAAERTVKQRKLKISQEEEKEVLQLPGLDSESTTTTQLPFVGADGKAIIETEREPSFVSGAFMKSSVLAEELQTEERVWQIATIFNDPHFTPTKMTKQREGVVQPEQKGTLFGMNAREISQKISQDELIDATLTTLVFGMFDAHSFNIMISPEGKIFFFDNGRSLPHSNGVINWGEKEDLYISYRSDLINLSGSAKKLTRPQLLKMQERIFNYKEKFPAVEKFLSTIPKSHVFNHELVSSAMEERIDLMWKAINEAIDSGKDFTLKDLVFDTVPDYKFAQALVACFTEFDKNRLLLPDNKNLFLNLLLNEAAKKGINIDEVQARCKNETPEEIRRNPPSRILIGEAKGQALKIIRDLYSRAERDEKS